MVDAVRLARLEAQAYWDETFVDLYDFCELLLRRCRDAFSTQLKQFVVFDELFLSDKYKASEAGDKPASRTLDEWKLKRWFLDTEGGRLWQKIHDACLAVLNEFKPDNRKEGIVPYSYYVCPNLQYSHGLSIYFPWTLPEDAIRFEQEKGREGQPTQDYRLITAFDEYRGYGFPSCDGTDWAGFLQQFFRATLRNVRMSDRLYDVPTKDSDHDLSEEREIYDYRPAPLVNLQKSSPDTGEDDDLPRPRIKNYPRRYYLSPRDCHNRCDEPGVETQSGGNQGEQVQRECVPYLGWKIRGLLADVIKWPKEGDDGDEADSR